MKPAPFEYLAPASVAEAVAALDQGGDEAKVLAGGQSLVPLLNLRLARPTHLIDINRVREMDYIRDADGGLAIGALTRQRTVERSDAVRARCPLLQEAVRFIGHPQIRNRGTVGGSLAYADPAAELPAVMVALDAELRIAGPKGERTVAAQDFFVSFLTTALEPGELLVEARLPAWPANTGWCFLELSRRRGDFALVGVAVTLTLDESRAEFKGGRIVFTGVEGRPARGRSAEQMLVGSRPSDALIEQIGLEAAAGLDPASDVHASGKYRRAVAGELVRRALRVALERARRGDAITT